MTPFLLPSGRPVARLGQGTWNVGDDRAKRAAEIATLRLGLELGLTLVDTAELYGSGRSEQLIGEAFAGKRDSIYLASKVLPSNASRRGTVKACERSLKRLGTDYLDLYLLHWRQSEPLEETLEAFVALQADGKIRQFGVSNFDRDDLEEARNLPGGTAIATNQVLYNLSNRGIDWQLREWCSDLGMPIMAYTPLGNGGAGQRAILANAAVRAVAARHAATPAQVALAWTLREPNVVTIPKASSEAHVRDNRAALDLMLTADDLRELDAAFPPPRRQQPLEML